LSGPLYVAVEQPCRPDVASVPLKANATGWLYQPPWSGPRAGVASVTVGGVVSTWMRFSALNLSPFIQSTSQLFAVPALELSADSVCTSQPDVLTTPSVGDHCHCSVTLVRYQALQSSGGAPPAVHVADSEFPLAGAAAVVATAAVAARHVI